MYIGQLFYKAWPNTWPENKDYTNAFTWNPTYFDALFSPWEKHLKPMQIIGLMLI